MLAGAIDGGGTKVMTGIVDDSGSRRMSWRISTAARPC